MINEKYPCSGVEIARLVRSGELSAVDVTREFLARVEADPYNAFITVMRDEALRIAERVDFLVASGKADDLPLAGVPVSIKDNICTSGVKTTCASKMLADFTPTYNATVYDRLISAGAVPVGKVNLDEFAIGSDGTSSYFGRTVNPLGEALIPGGSSSGSAVSVMARQALASLGSDTGGSARVPAALCGLWSLKPTYGAVSRLGLVGMAPSLEQICPMTATLEDNKLVFDVIRGADPKDLTTLRDEADFVIPEPQKLRVGVFLPADTRGYISSNVEKAVATIVGCGASVASVEMPFIDEIAHLYYILSSTEAASCLARFDGVRFGHRANSGSITDSRAEAFGPKLSERIAEGVFASYVRGGAMYADALQLRRRLTDAIDDLLREVDVIISPVTDCAEVKWGQTKFIGDRYTVYANLTGLPALTMPYGSFEGESGKLPLAIQLMGRRGEEDLLYCVAKMLCGEVEA